MLRLLSHWHRLIAAKTHKHLSTLQVAIFRGSWLGQKYEQIAQECYCSDTHVRIVGAELWDLLSQSLGEKVTKKTFKAALERCSQEEREPGESLPKDSQTAFIVNGLTASAVQIDWGEAPDVTIFYGPNREQAVLKQWITQDNCRLVTLLGMGGIGKTALSAKLAQDLSPQTDCQIRIWQVKTGKLLAICCGHTNWVRSVAFHPSQPILASGSGDRSVKLWDYTTGNSLSYIPHFKLKYR